MSGARRRLLIATHQLAAIQGSEVIALETARHFAATGCEITVFTNLAGRPMKEAIEAVTGTPILTDPAQIRPFSFDMAYVQHQPLGLFDYRASADDRTTTRIVTGRLSRRAYLESGGWLHDRILVDHVLANSELTAEHLASVGHDCPTTVFHNAAPAEYIAPFRARSATPRRILVVTNHRDPALIEAIEILRQRATVDHVGFRGDRIALVTPETIAGADLVVSIGKTIPYALAGRVPVYVYDHFGGPGYLDAGNIETAARFSFSGRCCERRLSGAEIAAEIIDGYAKGVAFARDTPQAWLQRFHLPRYLDLLLEPPRVSNAEKRRRMADAPFLAQERLLASHIRENHIRQQWLARQVVTLEQRLETLTDRPVRP